MWILGCKSVLHEYHTALTFKRVLLHELIVIPCPLKEESSAVVVNKARRDLLKSVRIDDDH